MTLFSIMTMINTRLEEMETENTNIQAGLSTVFDRMPEIVDALITLCESAIDSFLNVYLTDAQRTDFDNGDITMDGIVPIESISLFNSIQKIKMYAEQTRGSISTIPTKKTISYYANADDYTLTSDQFDDDGKNKIIDDSTFTYYTIQEGDTARVIAMRELGDPEKYVQILQLNNISESDLIDGLIVGQQIKIPVEIGSAERGDENLVYGGDDSDIDRFYHGEDVAEDVNGNIMVSPTGDITGVSGVENTYSAIIRRLDNSKGSLNVFSPNWGLTAIGDGNEPLMVRIDRYMTDLVNQIQADPRVESVLIDVKSLRLEGESLSVNGVITFIGSGQQREVSI